MLIKPIIVQIAPAAPNVCPKQPFIADIDGDFQTFSKTFIKERAYISSPASVEVACTFT